MASHAPDDADPAADPAATDAATPEVAGEAAVARAELVREIGGSGVWDDDPAWRDAFAAVPRHLFVPSYHVGAPGGYERRWGEHPDPAQRAEWLRGAYTDTALATRVRDGELVSSSSQPSLMARMLTALQVADGHTVLEIGAGTGYNAALMAHRLGDDRVTTIDLDPEITDAARAHLARAGHRPAVVTGDGARGCPERAPYDRIIATCTMDDVPRAWLAQCRPGARIVMPIATGLVALDVRDGSAGSDGGDGYGGRGGNVGGGVDRAEGRFLATPAFFVPLRGTGRRERREDGPQLVRGVPRRALREDGFRFLLVLTDGVLEPRDAVTLWDGEGHPERERYGITVDGERSWAWLDDPAGPYAWPL